MFRLKKVTPIHGRVIDERGKAVAGAKIQVEGTMLGLELDGHFGK